MQELNWDRRQIFTWSHGDGGPSKRPSPDGGRGYYWLPKEGRLLRSDDLDAEFRHCNAALHKLGSVPATAADADTRTLRGFLVDEGVTERFLPLADAGYCNTQGGTLDSVPVARACKFERAWEGDGSAFDPDFRMSPSYRILTEHLASGLEIRTRCPVTHVQVDADAVVVPPPAALTATGALPQLTLPAVRAVTVTCADGSVVRAHRVVVTAPLPIMRAREIAFTPPLSERKLAAYDSMSFANGVKVLLKFNRRPWPADCHGAVCADSFLPECWMNGTSPVGALITGKVDYSEWCAEEPTEGGDAEAGEEEEEVEGDDEAAEEGEGDYYDDVSLTMAPGDTSRTQAAASDCVSIAAVLDAAAHAAVPPSKTPVVPGVFYVCTGFTMGARADALVAMPQATVIARFLAQLDAMFDGDASGAFVSGHVHNWANEPYIRGAYSTPTMRDDADAAHAAMESHAGAVFFAGEATAGAVDASSRGGSVHFASPIVLHGAMATGSIAACDIARSLGVPVTCSAPGEEEEGVVTCSHLHAVHREQSQGDAVFAKTGYVLPPLKAS